MSYFVFRTVSNTSWAWLFGSTLGKVSMISPPGPISMDARGVRSSPGLQTPYFVDIFKS